MRATTVLVAALVVVCSVWQCNGESLALRVKSALLDASERRRKRKAPAPSATPAPAPVTPEVMDAYCETLATKKCNKDKSCRWNRNDKKCVGLEPTPADPTPPPEPIVSSAPTTSSTSILEAYCTYVGVDKCATAQQCMLENGKCIPSKGQEPTKPYLYGFCYLGRKKNCPQGYYSIDIADGKYCKDNNKAGFSIPDCPLFRIKRGGKGTCNNNNIQFERC